MRDEGSSGARCRLCFRQFQRGVNVLGRKGLRQKLRDKIQRYLGITVTVKDCLPKTICASCFRTVCTIHRFASMAVMVQDKLKAVHAAKLCQEGSQNGLNGKKAPAKGQEENTNLLRSYLTKGLAAQEEVTEMEVRIDPMTILQCAMDDDFARNSGEDEDEEEASARPSTLKGKAVQEKPYLCKLCPRGFNSDIALQNHFWIHLNHDRRPAAADVRVKVVPDNNASSPVNCPVCGKRVSSKGNLRVHIETHRPKGRFGCDICSRVFKTMANLERHKEQHGDAQFPCGVCGRLYPTNSTLRAHSITHSDLRPHQCPLCEKTFKRNQDLKFHMNQHTGARPYQCPYCPKAFASSGNCFSHRKRMHPRELERDRLAADEIS